MQLTAGVKGFFPITVLEHTRIFSVATVTLVLLFEDVGVGVGPTRQSDVSHGHRAHPGSSAEAPDPAADSLGAASASRTQDSVHGSEARQRPHILTRRR